MSQGRIKKLNERGFGFIFGSRGQDVLFETSDLKETEFEELRVGRRVSYTYVEGPLGPHAECVRLVDRRRSPA